MTKGWNMEGVSRKERSPEKRKVKQIKSSSIEKEI
jgi:hypothetical protein